MIDFDDITKEETKENNPNWQQIPDHPYKILIIRGSASGNSNLLLNMISHEPDIDKFCLNGKDPYKAQYQF